MFFPRRGKRRSRRMPFVGGLYMWRIKSGMKTYECFTTHSSGMVSPYFLFFEYFKTYLESSSYILGIGENAPRDWMEIERYLLHDASRELLGKVREMFETEGEVFSFWSYDENKTKSMSASPPVDVGRKATNDFPCLGCDKRPFMQHQRSFLWSLLSGNLVKVWIFFSLFIMRDLSLRERRQINILVQEKESFFLHGAKDWDLILYTCWIWFYGMVQDCKFGGLSWAVSARHHPAIAHVYMRALTSALSDVATANLCRCELQIRDWAT